MKYHNKTITLLEVPGETALVYTITGCPLKCEGCHSKHTWKKGSGEDLDMQTLTADLYLYNRMITAVCFMGGEWEEPDLIEALGGEAESGVASAAEAIAAGGPAAAPKVAAATAAPATAAATLPPRKSGAGVVTGPATAPVDTDPESAPF